MVQIALDSCSLILKKRALRPPCRCRLRKVEINATIEAFSGSYIGARLHLVMMCGP